MRLIARMRARLAAEDGYTMIAVIGAIALVSMLSAATLAATNGDLNLTQRDLDYKRAHAAAEAGLADYSFHLNNDNSYWARCTEVPSPESNPSAVNQVGSTANRRNVPESAAEYAIELLPASTSPVEECDPNDPTETMLEHGGANTGTFRIRSTGFSGAAKVPIVATYKRASLLDYIYFTQYETSDPATYSSSWEREYAYDHCEKYYREGRSSWCTKIVFISGDHIEGPLHTNDELAICGSPEFGRDASDVTEVSAPPEGWFDEGCYGYGGANPKFIGPLVTTAPVLKPPATNESLKELAGSEYTFSCQTEINLKGSQMEVTYNSGKNKTTTKTVPFPSDGVVYVENGSCKGKKWGACSGEYTPFDASYPSGSDCGTAIVRGYYSGELTIASENDILVENDITRSGSKGLLGLIANNFVRVKHECSGWGINGLEIDAAILAIEHSFIVDHYDCGSSLGTLHVTGAISQKYRGPVGTTGGWGGGTGYYKDYEYDDRLRYMEPPNFLNPIEPAWHIQRETLDFSTAE